MRPGATMGAASVTSNDGLPLSVQVIWLPRKAIESAHCVPDPSDVEPVGPPPRIVAVPALNRCNRQPVPAWVSILTGRHPVSTNARFNLMPRSMVHEGDTLADALRPRGYHSVFATDEVRFANFDASYEVLATIG